MVKEELNSEEKFFEKAVITEKFVKKYKKHMIASFVIITLIVVANLGYNLNKQSKITSANRALNELRQDATNSKALADLKVSSPKLFDVWSYSQAVANNDRATLKKLANSKALIVSDLATYELSNDAKSFDNYALKQNAIYKDLALVQSAVILMNNSKIDEAHEKLLEITAGSSLAKIAKALLHYGVK
jgi:hypothetical protein